MYHRHPSAGLIVLAIYLVIAMASFGVFFWQWIGGQQWLK